MTLVSSIIKDAYRESNLIALASDPTTAQSTEALRLLNTILLSTVGSEAGDGLKELNYGGDFDEASFTTQWVPDNIRLMLNLESATSLDLDPYPQEGQRLAIVDVGSNLATYNLTLSGNGRLIEGTSTLTLSTDDITRQWMYRSDTGNWVRISSVDTTDQMPFPEEFDNYFIIMLAMRLNPRYGREMTVETMRALSRSRSALNARYNQRSERGPDVTPLPSEPYSTRMFSNRDDFERGRIR